ncbi:phage major capsid protein [Caproicibacterium sp. BJN0003]|uniref:phage major capsid protein n=1 Tax=Caproicibacterium sp. BJN0003 TaxID=2994078 RepID=UPI0022565E77|nr:phage major capsid protein [Caproicibacterium sp. BJN0003]UZT82141.1 phage major capsid protein [Caproicibacterium sp. BJN0003]
MDKKAYLENRNKLISEAENFITSGKLEDAAAKTKEVEALDAKFDNEAQALANLNALKDNHKIPEFYKALNSNAENVIGNFEINGDAKENDVLDSAEYKKAFMNYVISGKEIPKKFQNVDTVTKTADAGVAIPTTTVQKIYEKMETLGMVLPLVTKTSYKGGVIVPISSVKPTATWVAEGASSDKQKKTIGNIVFSYYKLRCAISMDYEVENMAYPFFETQFVQNVSDAMVKAKETAIINGSGSGQPKGILKETPAGNVDITAAATAITYKDLCNAEAAENYDSAVWCMTKSTFMSQIAGMTDKNDQPIARVNMGINGKPEYSIFGRNVVLVNPDYMSSFAATVTSDTIVAFLYRFEDYIFNSGVGMMTKKYEDNDTDDTVIKAIEICDGKSVINDSLVTIVKKSA